MGKRKELYLSSWDWNQLERNLNAFIFVNILFFLQKYFPWLWTTIFKGVNNLTKIDNTKSVSELAIDLPANVKVEAFSGHECHFDILITYLGPLCIARVQINYRNTTF